MPPVTETREFKKLAEELYKKNLSLFNANRTLMILQKLYQVMASSFEMEIMVQKYIDAIITDMNFLMGAVYIKYPQENFLRLLALSLAKPTSNSKPDFVAKLQNLKVGLGGMDNIMALVYKSGMKKFVTSLLDVFSFVEDKDVIEKMESTVGIKSTAVYPIVFGSETLGVFLVSMGVKEKDLSQTDNEILSRVSTVFGVAVDRLMIYLNLQKVNEKLKALDAQKDEFISMAAHELRTPMTAIKGYVSMIIEGDTGDIPEKARGFLADANAINERLIRLVNNMLNVSRIEEGRMVYQEEEENLSSAVRTVFSQFRPEAERKGLELKLDVPASITDKVRVDPDRIQEVIGNLLSNAVKYTDKGSVVVRLVQPNANMVRFEVEDTGSGISKEEQEKLFRKFSRAESTVGKTTGTGLGLYISKLLVEKFGGSIGLSSEIAKGSTFWFELPLVS
ncbi:MAG: Sensor protein resE [Candidatus Woesebacteria bacterium GW2011_GWB1_39_12]|uniref:histidine kinase n=2 Tax=Candidatus Woeseibacteriota TaxID=1752722 RepID=A0A0G0MDJ6_9BACT|nr:MAG: Sensor protein resE [Candidatus Woesebacteria bacterium GW2011_GWA1_39_12]KKR01470.1 MAG: Sensor protein resE [Candidatus Woesebacteria bacterium GW2011_GWB1_39_12]